MANFTNEYGNGDSISIEAASSTHGKDIETTTIDTSLAGEISINLVLVDEVIYNFNRALNKIGMRIDHYTPTQTTDDPVGEGLDYGSFSDESLGTKTNMTVSFQIISDDEKLVEAENYDEIITAVNSVYNNPKYLLLDEEELQSTEVFFKKR